MITKKTSSHMLFDIEGISVAQLIEFLQGIENPEDVVVKVNMPVFDFTGEFMHSEHATVDDVTLYQEHPRGDPAYIALTSSKGM